MNKDLHVTKLEGRDEIVAKVYTITVADGVLTATSSAGRIIVQYNIRALVKWEMK